MFFLYQLWCLDGLKGVFGQSECLPGSNLRCFDGTLAEGNKLLQRTSLELSSSFAFDVWSSTTKWSDHCQCFFFFCALSQKPYLISGKRHVVSSVATCCAVTKLNVYFLRNPIHTAAHDCIACMWLFFFLPRTLLCLLRWICLLKLKWTEC